MKFKLKTLFIIFLLMQFTNGSGGDKLLFYRAADRADIEIVAGRAGLIRTVYCDVYIEYVDNESWDFLKTNNLFKGGGSGNPVLPCFHFIVVNTWNKPFIVDTIEALYKGQVIPAEDFSFIKDKNYTGDRYAVDISSLLKNRRIFSDKNLLRDIDFGIDTVEYKLGFIAPGDRISTFRFFQRIPAGKSSKIRVAIKYFDMKKVIDFDISRFDYKEIENMQQQAGFLK